MHNAVENRMKTPQLLSLSEITVGFFISQGNQGVQRGRESPLARDYPIGAGSALLKSAIAGADAQIVHHSHHSCLVLMDFQLAYLVLVPVIGADFESRHTVFLFLVYDAPAHPFRKLPTGFPLYRDIRLVLIVVIYLLGSGNAV